jgi:unsaturated chondroitin disaccharide hydrolase
MTQLWTDALARMRARVAHTAKTVTIGFPHFADPATGAWTTSPAGDWTGGFWNGMLWLAARYGDDPRARAWAADWTARLRPRAESDTVFRGFLFYYGAALGAMLCGDASAREIALAGAHGLASSYNARAEALPLGAAAEEASDIGAGEANVDTVQASALLLWAHRETGDAVLRDIAIRHAARHIEFCLRDDGSVCQSASFDPATGRMLRRYTHKGIRDDSTWARAQAWGILGWTLAHLWSGESRFRDAAERAADWWVGHAPADRVAFWDFDDPKIPDTFRDTSATAIVTASLLTLAPRASTPQRARTYRDAAEAAAAALVERYVRPDGMLTDGCYSPRIGLATRHELVWGSYYLFEALHTLAGLYDPGKIA